MPSSAVQPPAPHPASPVKPFAVVLRESRQQVVTQFLHTCRNELPDADRTNALRRLGSWIGDHLPETNDKIMRALQLADMLSLNDEAIHWIDLSVEHLVNIVLPELEDRHRAFLNAKGTAN